MDPNTKNTALGAAGAAGAAGPLGVEDVFSTYLYDGNNGTQTITNGIDLAGEGGLVWQKARTQYSTFSLHHILTDTERGVNKTLRTNATDAESSVSYGVNTFNSDGFTLNDTYIWSNSNLTDFVSWTFRKAPGFFDVVTYTGDGTGERSISHNLGAVPAVMIHRRYTSTANWLVYHKDATSLSQYLLLNSNATVANQSDTWGTSAPTSTTFNIKSSYNAVGESYVVYLFADDEAVFGENADQSIIKCGSYTGTGSEQFIDLGWEPQFLLHKSASYVSDWKIFDNMRGWSDTAQTRLNANESVADSTATADLTLTSTGFRDPGIPNGSTVTYIAIRRGPMKTPTDATEVFNANAYSGTGATRDITGIGFPLDANLTMRRETHTANVFVSRLQGLSCIGSGGPSTPYLATDSTNAESTAAVNSINATSSSAMDGYTIFNAWTQLNDSGGTYASYSFRRAPGFFDVVAYTGTGSAQAVNHNLGVAPELIITKPRNFTDGWGVQVAPLGATKRLRLDLINSASTTSAYWNNTSPTSSVFTVGSDNATNGNTYNYIAYLFATVSGVSKVGSYTGTGSNINVDCGFSAGARFVLIKRTDSTGDWYVWDTARGIVSGNDPYLLLNTTDAEVTTTDYIDPYASGFTVTSTAPAALNASGGNYIFLAIA